MTNLPLRPGCIGSTFDDGDPVTHPSIDFADDAAAGTSQAPPQMHSSPNSAEDASTVECHPVHSDLTRAETLADTIRATSQSPRIRVYDMINIDTSSDEDDFQDTPSDSLSDRSDFDDTSRGQGLEQEHFRGMMNDREPSMPPDLAESIGGLYRILELKSEQGSGGLGKFINLDTRRVFD